MHYFNYAKVKLTEREVFRLAISALDEYLGELFPFWKNKVILKRRGITFRGFWVQLQ